MAASVNPPRPQEWGDESPASPHRAPARVGGDLVDPTPVNSARTSAGTPVRAGGMPLPIEGRPDEERTVAILHAAFARIAEEHEVNPQQVRLAWELTTPPVVIPIPGSTRPSTIHDSAATADLTLTEPECAALAAATPLLDPNRKCAGPVVTRRQRSQLRIGHFALQSSRQAHKLARLAIRPHDWLRRTSPGRAASAESSAPSWQPEPGTQPNMG